MHKRLGGNRFAVVWRTEDSAICTTGVLPVFWPGKNKGEGPVPNALHAAHYRLAGSHPAKTGRIGLSKV
jgi:hypothetical protein